MNALSRLFGAPTFSHGIHPDDFKSSTKDLPVVRMPFVKRYVLPLSQHLGAPSRPIVKAGDSVRRGQLIAEPEGFVSAALHAPVSGRVVAIEPADQASGRMSDAIVLESDPHSAQTLYAPEPDDWTRLSAEELLSRVGRGGFVGLGGAAFPTHVKLSVPPGKRADVFLVNAAECEPYLTSDFRVMLENAPELIAGIRICMKILGAQRAYVGTEQNKQEAADHLQKQIPPDLQCEIIALQTRYPQGAEKMLAEAVLHREIPSGQLPIDAHLVVQNVGTVAAIGAWFMTGLPMIERVVTISGPGIRAPKNLLIPIGTPLDDVIRICGGMTPDVRQVLFGGPMMGSPQRVLGVPVTKGTSGVLFLTGNEVTPRPEYACIRCARCVDACPVFLNPSRLGALARNRRYSEMREYHILDCMECGSCSWVCPSNIPLVQRFRVAKALLKEEDQRAKESRA